MTIGRIIETYEGQLFISIEDGNYIDPFTGKIWSIIPPSVLRIYNSPINDSLRSGKVIWEDIKNDNDENSKNDQR